MTSPWKIRVSQSVLDNREVEAVTQVVQKGFLGMGPEVNAFENELVDFFKNGRQVTCVNTGTAALQLAVQAAGISQGDEVLVPSITYVASYQAIAATGATPIPCDVRLSDGTLDVNSVRERITGKTKAIMPVHYAGGVGDLALIYQLAEENDLRIIEDAAHAFGTTVENKLVGSFGDIICFSFDGIKNITSGEGGAVVTSDDSITQKIKDARLLGVENDTEKRFKQERSWNFDVTAQGWRYHMSDLMAAIGRVQLEKFPYFKEVRQSLSRAYSEKLKNQQGVETLTLDLDNVVPHIFPVRILDNKRDLVRNALHEEGILTGLHYAPNHRLTFFAQENCECPNADRFFEEILTLPLHPAMTIDDVDEVLSVLHKILLHS